MNMCQVEEVEAYKLSRHRSSASWFDKGGVETDSAVEPRKLVVMAVVKKGVAIAIGDQKEGLMITIAPHTFTLILTSIRFGNGGRRTSKV